MPWALWAPVFKSWKISHLDFFFLFSESSQFDDLLLDSLPEPPLPSHKVTREAKHVPSEGTG